MQSAHPGWHPEYVHPAPLQAAPLLCVVSQTFPQPAQFVTLCSDVSQPLTFGAAALQSPYPGAQPAYTQPPSPQAAPALCVVSQTLPQPVQFSAVSIRVSQPSRSGTP